MKNIPVLFENDSCLVLDKPAGLPVQGGEGIRVSLDSLLAENYSPRPFLVHRLDKDTSGILLVAKTKEAAAAFSALFAGRSVADNTGKGRSVSKQYTGICSGIPVQKEAVIRLDLDFPGKDRTIVVKKSETRYRVLSKGTAADIPFSHLLMELGTGRMHQIRRHLAGIGHPLLGDDKHGDFSLNKKLRKECGLKNLLLHASRLVIPPFAPFLPEGIDISSPLPCYFSLITGSK